MDTIASARTKTVSRSGLPREGGHDRTRTAKLHAGGFLPEVWVADDETQRRRCQTGERMGALEQKVRTEGRIHAILHANLIPKYSGHLFGRAGRAWLRSLPLPDEEKGIVSRLMDILAHSTEQLALLDKTIAREALNDPQAVRLMTIPGIGPVVAATVLASIGDISRFSTPEKLSCYFGLTPKVRQSADYPARHGRISKQGNTHARKMLVEAAWLAKLAPGPLRAFFERLRRTRGAAAAAVATARKLAVIIWQVLTEEKECAFARPAFTAMKNAESRAQGWCSSRIRQSETWSRLLDQGNPREGKRLRGASRGSLRANGGGMGCKTGKSQVATDKEKGAVLSISSSQHPPSSGTGARRRGNT